MMLGRLVPLFLASSVLVNAAQAEGYSDLEKCVAYVVAEHADKAPGVMVYRNMVVEEGAEVATLLGHTYRAERPDPHDKHFIFTDIEVITDTKNVGTVQVFGTDWLITDADERSRAKIAFNASFDFLSGESVGKQQLKMTLDAWNVLSDLQDNCRRFTPQ